MTYIFKKDDLIVDVWYRRMMSYSTNGSYNIEIVPNLFNLRSAVLELLNQKTADKTNEAMNEH